MTDWEIMAAKNDLFLDKEDILKYLNKCVEDAIDEKDKSAYGHMIEKVKEEEIETLAPTWDKDVVTAYYFSGEDFAVVKADVPVRSMEFYYDNEAHELYLMSFTIENEVITVS